MLNFGKTSYNDFVLERGEYLRLVGAPNGSLGLIDQVKIIDAIKEAGNVKVMSYSLVLLNVKFF